MRNLMTTKGFLKKRDAYIRASTAVKVGQVQPKLDLDMYYAKINPYTKILEYLKRL